MPGSDETRVGHCKADAIDVYIGRGPDGRDMSETEVGERGWLGNPFALDDGYSRAESIDHFRESFESELAVRPDFRDSVRDLSGKRLGCWCQRLNEDGPACHGEVIAEWADRLATNNDTEDSDAGE